MRPKQAGSPRLPLGVLYAAGISCAIALAAVGYYTLLGPIRDWRGDVARRCGLVREKLAEGPELRGLHAKQTQELANLLARVEEVNRRVPDEPREGEFLADLSRLAERSGVSIEDFRRGATIDAETHSVVTVSVRVRGPHEGLSRLLNEVANLPRLAELTQLHVSSNATRAAYPAQLTYALYYGMTATPVDAASL